MSSPTGALPYNIPDFFGQQFLWLLVGGVYLKDFARLLGLFWPITIYIVFSWFALWLTPWKIPLVSKHGGQTWVIIVVDIWIILSYIFCAKLGGISVCKTDARRKPWPMGNWDTNCEPITHQDTNDYISRHIWCPDFTSVMFASCIRLESRSTATFRHYI